ncbi:desmocollin 2-like protein [Brachyhypopomus gauderio]|uniref:desmocollin 2-like protein n=1 Tax=Brachyhypopomus gauderio TaxID=698409 RepID=UPI004041FD08
MFKDDIFSVGLFFVFLCSSAESCVQTDVQAQVPQRLQRGHVISKVNLGNCGTRHLDLTCSDPDFAVKPDGTILTSQLTTIPDDGRSFSVLAKSETGQTWRVNVALFPADQVFQKSSNDALKRFKRRWRPPPFNVIENDKGPFPKNVEYVASDSSVDHIVYYTVEGMGIDSEPVGIFRLYGDSGLLQILQAVDREQYSRFDFVAHAFDKFSNVETDQPLPITVYVQDVNDNAPEFSSLLIFVTEEHSKQGTYVGIVNATDKDEPNTLHTKIKYSLLNCTDLFTIDPYSGVLRTSNDRLDRETQDRYYVQMEIRDMNGAPDGLSRTGVAVVSLTDINDNPPTFRQTVYKAKVLENQSNVQVLRIPVDDLDLKGTPNWKAEYDITKGNESGNFWITTDPTTNEGLLYVVRPLDREKQEKLNLEVRARNQVPLTRTTATWQTVPVELSVEDVDEGPEFSVPILQLRVKENLPNGTHIGVYTAIDPETKSSTGIKYYKIPQSDRGSWISVVENTGELKTANIIDRESPLVINDTYNITVKAVDQSQKSGTGTVMILIEDVNDNSPFIKPSKRVACTSNGKRGSVLIKAEDYDKPPYAIPFSFELGSEFAGKWKLTNATATTVMLEPAEDMPNGMYQVPLIIKDLQGEGDKQMVSIRVCDCQSNGECPDSGVSARLGGWAILAMLLSLLLLLLLCLLLLFVCTTKGEKLQMIDDDGSGGMLLKSNTEAPGEEVKEAPLLIAPGSKVDGGSFTKGGGGGTIDYRTIGSYGGQNVMGQQSVLGGSQGMYGTGQFNTFQKYSDMATVETWRTNELYLDNKLYHFGEEDDGRFAADVLKPYGYEGAGSPAGSVGCCSILSDREPVDFLDSLGPKFRTLADVCTSRAVKGGQ